MRSFRALLRTLSMVGFGVLIATSVMADDVQISERARAHFRAGVNYMQDPDGARYEGAYREFRAAYAESPSWKILGNLGIAAMKLERDGEAVEAFKKYLSEGGNNIDADERAQMERDTQTLQASLVTITVSSNPPGAAILDQRAAVRGDAINNAYGPVEGSLQIGIRPGNHKITARLAGYQDATWDLDARPGAQEQHVFELKKVEDVVPGGAGGAGGVGGGGGGAGDTGVTAMERPVPAAVFIGLAATGLFAVGAGVTGIMATSKKGEFEDANNGSDPEKAKDLQDSGKTLNLVTDILIGGAVVAAGVTAVLYISRPEVPAQADTGALRITPLIGPRAGALSISGHF